MFDIAKIDYADPKVWELIGAGFNIGIFQCESKLLKKWLKRIEPKNLWELSLVISLVRPGCLESGMTDEYCAYRDGKEFKSFGHPVIDEIFNCTGGVMVFQEQLMSLGAKLAWSHLPYLEKLAKVDKLRKATAKKSQKAVVDIGKEFVDGCIINKIDKELADKLFEVIKNCGRYLFNSSHAIKYAAVGYQTAYLKCHYPLQFLTTYLTYAQFCQKKWAKIFDIAQEARILGIDILPPNINKKNEHFSIEDGKIRYGLSHIKFFGGKTIDLVKTLPTINNWKQFIYLCFSEMYGKALNSKTAETLICCGAFSDIKMGRKSLLGLYKFLTELSGKELEYVVEHLDDIDNIDELPKIINSCIEEISRSKRHETIRSNLTMLDLKQFDHPAWIEKEEKGALGIALTASGVDIKDSTAIDNCVNCNGDFEKSTIKEINVIIDTIRETTTKKGKNPGQKMACITVHDASGELQNLPLFPEAYALYYEDLIENNTVKITLMRTQTGWMISSLEQI